MKGWDHTCPQLAPWSQVLMHVTEDLSKPHLGYSEAVCMAEELARDDKQTVCLNLVISSHFVVSLSKLR